MGPFPTTTILPTKCPQSGCSIRHVKTYFDPSRVMINEDCQIDYEYPLQKFTWNYRNFKGKLGYKDFVFTTEVYSYCQNISLTSKSLFLGVQASNSLITQKEERGDH